MINGLISVFFILSSTFFVQQDIQDKYYKALNSDSLELINNQIGELEKMPTTPIIRAYMGAIIMKRASYEPLVKDKVSIFKKGHELLEGEIIVDDKNTEYLFLRLAVQEHAPNILNYSANISADKSIIINQFHTLSFTVQKQIIAYSKKSKILSPDELQ